MLDIAEFLNKTTEAVKIGNIYREAWQVLYNCFGERMQNEEQEIMDSVLQNTKLDFKEKQNAI